jgi:alkylated DNA repair dioxygenase AlkB
VAFARLDIPEADILLDPEYLAPAERAPLFAALRETVPWETHRIRIFGREVGSPRLSCWIGDPEASYVYSGTRFEPQAWTPALLALRDRIAATTGARFDSVLANLYRDGRDSMGLHADDEPELGHEPVIASLSLGAPRRFVLKHRSGRGERHVVELGDGALLVMRGTTQRHWHHALPKTARPVGERINLTFRWIDPTKRRGVSDR